MNYSYRITRDCFDRQVRVSFANSSLINLSMFLNLASRRALLRAVDALQEDPVYYYGLRTGDQMLLEAREGMVQTQIRFSGGCAVARLPVEVFLQVTQEYLEEADRMYRELGSRNAI